MSDFVEGWWDVDDATYYADRECVSHSSLELFRKNVSAYKAVYVDGKGSLPPTKEMELGKAFHLALLEPDVFRTSVAVAPKCDRRTKDGKKVWEEFCLDSQGKIVISTDDNCQIAMMLVAVMQNPLVGKLFGDGCWNEKAVRWLDEETGMKMRCKLDVVTSAGVILDIKTSSSAAPEAFSRSCMTYGYHRQAATYVDALSRLSVLGLVERRDPEFYFIVVETSPYPECVVYKPTEEFVKAGRLSNSELLHSLRDCRDFDEWSGRYSGLAVKLDVNCYSFSSKIEVQHG